jgi:hypothetical protein
MNVARVFILGLLMIISFGAGMLYSARYWKPLIVYTYWAAQAELAQKCLDQYGFEVVDRHGQRRLFLCMYAPSGYRVTPDGETIEPTPNEKRGYRPPSESGRF